MDTQGFVLCAVVHEASLPDREGARLGLQDVHARYPRLTKIWADMGYRGEELRACCQTACQCDLEVVQKPAKTVLCAAGEVPSPRPAFTVLPHRWIVERTIGWLGRGRRFSKDYEQLPTSGEAWIYVAVSRLLMRRLERLARQQRTTALERKA